MKVLFINRFYSPDHSPTSELLTQLACDLLSKGFTVEVLTSRARYDDPSASLPSKEVISGVKVTRVWTTRFGRRRMLGRAIDYLTFYLSAALVLLKAVHRADVVVAKTDPPLISVVAAAVCLIKGAKLVNWLQDVFPEVGARLGMRALSGVGGVILTALRDMSLRVAYRNVVLGDRMAKFLRSRRQCRPASIVVIGNWADGDRLQQRLPPRDVLELKRELGLSDTFVIGYAGNMGRAHEFEAIKSAIAQVGESEMRFVFVGGGSYFNTLRFWVQQRSYHDRVLFLPYQPAERLREVIGMADVHLISLLPEMEGLIVPSTVMELLEQLTLFA